MSELPVLHHRIQHQLIQENCGRLLLDVFIGYKCQMTNLVNFSLYTLKMTAILIYKTYLEQSVNRG